MFIFVVLNKSKKWRAVFPIGSVGIIAQKKLKLKTPSW